MAATFALDTSCMIAAVCGWHEAHRRAAAAVERRLADGEQMAVAVHALSEAYAVLTRLPGADCAVNFQHPTSNSRKESSSSMKAAGI